MDFVLSSGIKVPNAVIVSGTLNSSDDEGVLDFFKQYGTFRAVPVVDPNSEFFKNLIVEYRSGNAIDALTDLLPYTYEVEGKPGVKYHVRALSSVYTAKVGGSATKSYLDEIKQVAKLSGKSFEEVLKSMMTEISEIIGSSETDDECMLSSMQVDDPNRENQLHPSLETSEIARQQFSEDPPQVGLIQGGAEPHLPVDFKKSPFSAANSFNPPEIQKVIVEHIVKKDDLIAHSYSPMRLRSFSGRIPRPSGETDYDTWRSHVELLRKDPAMSELQKSRKIFESLLSPAADIVNRLSPEAAPETYLQLLDAAFGTVEDGEELFAQFMNTLQDPGEKASAYLCRLQGALNLTLKRGGVSAGDADKHILKQFCRGCWDHTLLSDLNLENKKSQPPTFSELLLMLRTEEDRLAAKATRMKKHLGSTRQRVVAHCQKTCTCSELQAVTQSDSDPLTDLRKQVASLQSQLTNLMAKKQKKSSKPKDKAECDLREMAMATPSIKVTSAKPANLRQSNQPKPWYCFKCGQDGHISASCSNDPDPTLVADKRKQLREKRRIWEMQNTPSADQDF